MTRAILISLLAVASLVPLTVAAKGKKRLPLPVQIMTAKTVYIDNQSGIAKLGDKAYEEMSKWGRFQIVTQRKQADLILLLSAHEYDGGYVTTGGGQTGSIDQNGNINTTNQPTYTTHVTVAYPLLCSER